MIYSSFTPSRMLKSGAHAVTSTTFAQIAGWVADSSIPGSSVVDNALIANGSSTEDIVALIPYTGGGYGNTTYVELRKNGIAIGSGDFKSNGAGTVTITVADHSFLGGDAFTLWARRSNFNVNIAPDTTRVAIG